MEVLDGGEVGFLEELQRFLTLARVVAEERKEPVARRVGALLLPARTLSSLTPGPEARSLDGPNGRGDCGVERGVATGRAASHSEG